MAEPLVVITAAVFALVSTVSPTTTLGYLFSGLAPTFHIASACTFAVCLDSDYTASTRAPCLPGTWPDHVQRPSPEVTRKPFSFRSLAPFRQRPGIFWWAWIALCPIRGALDRLRPER